MTLLDTSPRCLTRDHQIARQRVGCRVGQLIDIFHAHLSAHRSTEKHHERQGSTHLPPWLASDPANDLLP